MNIASKLTSRKFWVALAGLVVGILALFKVDANTTTQISGVVMSLGSVIAYIVGEGLVDAASAGATVNITGNPTITAGDQATTPDTAQAAEVKADMALSSTGTATQSASDSKVTAPAVPAPQTASQPESGAVAPNTTGAE